MKRDIYQRRIYAMHRATLAVDRLIHTCSREEHDRANLWAKAWGRRAALLSVKKKLSIFHQRRAYAARRACLAVDRLITSTSREKRDKASLWAKVWGECAGLLGSARKRQRWEYPELGRLRA